MSNSKNVPPPTVGPNGRPNAWSLADALARGWQPPPTYVQKNMANMFKNVQGVAPPVTRAPRNQGTPAAVKELADWKRIRGEEAFFKNPPTHGGQKHKVKKYSKKSVTRRKNKKNRALSRRR